VGFFYLWVKINRFMKKYLLLPCLALALTSCISTRNTIKNIDDKAVMPALTKDKNFVITEISTEAKYGYDADYPVNLGFMPFETAEVNVKRYFGALTGPAGQTVTYKKVDSCCPFPTEKYTMGAGLLDIYEVSWQGLATPKRIYINLYEKGQVSAPEGFSIRKI
jgi:hypothetical protein